MLYTSSIVLVCLFTLPVFGQDAVSTSANLIQKAQAAYQTKHFSESASLYERVLLLVQEEDERTDVELELARAQAMAGDRAAAFKTLDQAVEDGYIDRNSIEADPGLISLHADQRWQPLLERMSKATAAQDARWGDAAFATPYAKNISDAEKLAGLSELWAQAKYGFANFWHVPQLNWDQTYLDFIPKVLATRSTDEYYRVLQRFYVLLKDGHTQVYPPEWYMTGKIGRLPLQTRLVDGHLLVIGSRAPAFDMQGLHAGDEIVTINSEPAIAWAERNVAPFMNASTSQDSDVRIYDSNLFLAPIGTTFTLRTLTPSGKFSTHVFTVTKNIPHHRPPFELKFLPGNIAYVALNEFDNDTDAKEWDKHWPEISKAKALILDLRENGGGNSSVGNHILATLIDKPVPGESEYSTRWIATYRAWGMAEIPLHFSTDTVVPDPARHFSGPVVLLIGPKTFSAAEDFTVSFAQSHRGEMIGEPTGGSTGQPLSFALPGGGTARVCTKHDSFADGKHFVGVGIQPDILVHQTHADIIGGRDPVFEAAIRALETKA